MLRKRLEQKIPILIIDVPWHSSQLDLYEYRVKRFKKCEPQKFATHINNLTAILEKIKSDVDAMFPPRNSH